MGTTLPLGVVVRGIVRGSRPKLYRPRMPIKQLSVENRYSVEYLAWSFCSCARTEPPFGRAESETHDSRRRREGDMRRRYKASRLDVGRYRRPYNKVSFLSILLPACQISQRYVSSGRRSSGRCLYPLTRFRKSIILLWEGMRMGKDE
jgi:hypothetical protein